LVKHPFVQECAVVASPDEIRGNIVKAFIVLKKDVDQNNPDLVKELQDHVKKWTAPYKYPRQIDFIDELPKTTSGKIRRIELRNKEKQKQEINGILYCLELERCKILFYQEFLCKHAVLMERRTASNPEWNA